jgi:hypothetical protein
VRTSSVTFSPSADMMSLSSPAEMSPLPLLLKRLNVSFTSAAVLLCWKKGDS